MSDYETSTFKAMTEDRLLKTLLRGNSLLCHKVKLHGLSFHNASALSISYAESDTSGITGKYAPAVSIRVLKDTPKVQRLLSKLAVLDSSINELIGNRGNSFYDIQTHLWSCDFYAGSIFQSVMDRNLKATALTKRCNKCGHRHSIDQNRPTANIKGCKACGDQFYFFRKSDFKKHTIALEKLEKLESKKRELVHKIDVFKEKSISSNKYFWYVCGGTKAVFEALNEW